MQKPLGQYITVFSLRKRLTELGTSARVFTLESCWGDRRQKAMDAISNYIAGHPSCSRADIHRDCKAAVSWIRANDPASYSLVVEAIHGIRSLQLRLMLPD